MAKLNSRSRHWHWLWLLLLLPLGIAYLHHRAWLTRPVILPDGRTLEVINYNQTTHYTITPKGRDEDHFLWFRFYSDSSNAKGRIADAHTVVPFLKPIADGLGLRSIKVEAARPMFARFLPLRVRNWTVRYDRDSTGTWNERRL